MNDAAELITKIILDTATKNDFFQVTKNYHEIRHIVSDQKQILGNFGISLNLELSDSFYIVKEEYQFEITILGDIIDYESTYSVDKWYD